MMLPGTGTRVIVQGITGERGAYHTGRMIEAGTKVVAGVAPGRGGLAIHGVPVYETVSDAIDEHEADATVVFTPPSEVPPSVYEAVEDELKLVVVSAKGVPLRDTIRFVRLAREKGTAVIGPASAGIARPGASLLGSWPYEVLSKGDIAIVTRFCTLGVAATAALTSAGLGQSLCISLGGEHVVGTDERDVLPVISEDNRTKAVLLVIDPMRSVVPMCEALEELKLPAVAYVPGSVDAAIKRLEMVKGLESAGALVVGSLEGAIAALSEFGGQ